LPERGVREPAGVARELAGEVESVHLLCRQPRPPRPRHVGDASGSPPCGAAAPNPMLLAERLACRHGIVDGPGAAVSEAAVGVRLTKGSSSPAPQAWNERASRQRRRRAGAAHRTEPGLAAVLQARNAPSSTRDSATRRAWCRSAAARRRRSSQAGRRRAPSRPSPSPSRASVAGSGIGLPMNACVAPFASTYAPVIQPLSLMTRRSVWASPGTSTV